MLYGDRNWEILLSRQDNLEHLAIAMAKVVAPAILLFKLESGEA